MTCRAPGSPLAGPTLAPDAAQHRGAAVISTGQKGDHGMLASHESSQAHREHIRTSGFYLPFSFLAPQRVDWGVKFVRCLSCDRLTTSHTHTHSLSHSQRTSCCILLIHVVGFHILLAPLKRYVPETISGRNKPASVQPKGFP